MSLCFFLLNFEFTSISSNFPEGGQEIAKLFLNDILIFRKPYCFYYTIKLNSLCCFERRDLSLTLGSDIIQFLAIS